MSTTILDVEAIRACFSALDRKLAFLDGPGGTQVPDSVIEAITSYLRECNANLSGMYETSRRTEAIVESAHEDAARFLGCASTECGFGANMTSLNFALTRALARDLVAGDEIVCTRLDHDGNVAPWLELAHDIDVTVRFADLVPEDCTLNMSDLEHQLTDRTRVVAFPWASNAVGTVTDVRRIAELAHSVGALAWVDAVHYAPHGPIDVAEAGVDVLICSPYKFFGPHLGLFYVRADLLEGWRPYKVRPAPNDPPAHRFETGTLPHELVAGFSATVAYIESVGWEAIGTHERQLGERFLDGMPSHCRLYGLPTMEGRVPTFAFNVGGLAPQDVAERLVDKDIAVWHGNYYAVEVMRRLGLEEGGAVRAGIVHYNTADEIDRLLEALQDLGSSARGPREPADPARG